MKPWKIEGENQKCRRSNNKEKQKVNRMREKGYPDYGFPERKTIQVRIRFIDTKLDDLGEG
ncbi:MAG: hypothetical protein ABSB40_04440 [Nitrososphaeria archaeon]|jgi:hypothetical protein